MESRGSERWDVTVEDQDQWSPRVVNQVSKNGVKDTTREIVMVLGAWIKGQFLISLWVTGLYLAGFAIARTPLWPVLAILCGLASVIPHVGGLLALGLVLLFSFAGSGGETWVMVAALAVWVLVSLIEAFILGPR